MRYDLRQEPYEGIPHVRIRGGGSGTTWIPTPTELVGALGPDSDGIIDKHDDDEELEEGAGDGAGLLVNGDPHGTTPLPGGGADKNLRRCLVRLSSQHQTATYGQDYKVYIVAEWARLHGMTVWADQNRQTPIEYDTSVGGWRLDIPAGGGEIEIWIGRVSPADDTVPSCLVRFFLTHFESDEGSAAPAAARFQALDEILVTFSKWGLDVDSNNDGTFDEPLDDWVEELPPGMIVVTSEPARTDGYELRVRQHPVLDGFVTPTVRLIQSGAGRVLVRNDNGGVVLAETADDVALLSSDFDGVGVLDWRVAGRTAGRVKLELQIEVGGQVVAHDWLYVTVVNVDAKVSNGLENWSGGQLIVESDEESVGAVTVANLNDTNANGTIDCDEVGGVTGEKDLMRFTLVKPNPATDVFAEFRVRIASGDIRAYNESVKQNRIDGLTLGLNDFSENSNTEETWWLEARAGSATVRDVDVRYEGRVVNTESWIQLDRVRATAVWVSGGNARYAGALPGDCGPDASTVTAENAAVNGSLFGLGACTAENGFNTRKAGRLLVEFTIGPAGVDGLPGVAFDVTRQVQGRLVDIETGSGTIVTDGGFTRDFPAEDESPNDDGGDSDEDNTPTNRHIYAFDAPGGALSAGATGAFTVWRYTFREWVRVRFDATAGTPRPFSNTNGTEEGGRCSGKHDWHLLMYQRRGSTGEWIDDWESPCASHPTFTGTGNGTMSAPIVDAAAVTAGFTATYASATDQWTMAGTTVGPDAGGGTWTIAIAGKVTVVINRGTTAFADGDAFRFSIFRTARAAGKDSEIDDGFIDALDGP